MITICKKKEFSVTKKNCDYILFFVRLQRGAALKQRPVRLDPADPDAGGRPQHPLHVGAGLPPRLAPHPGGEDARRNKGDIGSIRKRDTKNKNLKISVCHLC